jgi:hypothetical protein
MVTSTDRVAINQIKPFVLVEILADRRRITTNQVGQ